MEGSAPEKRKWRKKRKTVLSNAKKYQKKGQLGRGTKMSDENYQYFMNILEVMQKGVETAEERQTTSQKEQQQSSNVKIKEVICQLFHRACPHPIAFRDLLEILVNNVLERTVGEELNISCNQLGCRIVELLLPYSQPSDLERFMTALSPDLRKLCSDNFSSHVVEKLLTVACDRSVPSVNCKVKEEEEEEEKPEKRAKKEDSNEASYPDEHKEMCRNFTLKVCRYALNNLEEFVWDSYANHILRTAIKCVGGVEKMPEKSVKKEFKDGLAICADSNKETSKKATSEVVFRCVPDEYTSIAKEYASRLLQWPQFNELPYQVLTSGLLQVLLYSSSNTDKKLTTAIIKKLLDESFVPEGQDCKDGVASQDTLPRVFKSEPSLRLLETMLAVARSKMYTQIYAKCFITRLGALAVMSGVNFAVQRLFDNCDLQEEFEPMFDEVADKFNDILFSGNTGVIVAIAKACLRLKSRQAQFVTSLEKGLKCTEPDQQRYFAILCCRLLPLDRVKGDDHSKDYFVNVHGSVVAQTILQFNRPIKAVASLLEMTTDELLVLFKDAKGCRIAEVFCEGQFVGVKARDKMIWKLKGTYPDLALSKYGSRAMEAVFKCALFEQKCKIMDEITSKGLLMLGTPFGRIIFNKLNVEMYKTSKEQWRASMVKAGMMVGETAEKSRDKKKKKRKLQES